MKRYHKPVTFTAAQLQRISLLFAVVAFVLLEITAWCIYLDEQATGHRNPDFMGAMVVPLLLCAGSIYYQRKATALKQAVCHKLHRHDA